MMSRPFCAGWAVAVVESHQTGQWVIAVIAFVLSYHATNKPQAKNLCCECDTQWGSPVRQIGWDYVSRPVVTSRSPF